MHYIFPVFDRFSVTYPVSLYQFFDEEITNEYLYEITKRKIPRRCFTAWNKLPNNNRLRKKFRVLQYSERRVRSVNLLLKFPNTVKSIQGAFVFTFSPWTLDPGSGTKFRLKSPRGTLQYSIQSRRTEQRTNH